MLTEADRLPDIIVQRFVLEGLRFKIVRWVMVLNREYVYEGRTHSLNKLFKIVELTKATDALIKIAWYRAKVGGKAALPPELRKASGFPPRTASLLALGSAGRLSLPAEPRGSVRADTSERRSLSASRVRGTAEPLWDVTFRGLWRDPASHPFDAL